MKHLKHLNNEYLFAREMLIANSSFLEHIKEFEGFSNTPYACPAGVKTIGYGFTDKKYTSRFFITRGEADRILLLLLTDIIVKLRKMYRNLTEAQYLALASFCYNLGINTLKDKRRNLSLYLSYYNNIPDNYYCNKFIEHLHRYVFSNGKKFDGLVKRRSYESKLFISGHAGRV